MANRFVIFDIGGDFYAVTGSDLKAMLDLPIPGHPAETVFSFAKIGEPVGLRAVEIFMYDNLFLNGTADVTGDLLELIAARIIEGAEWEFEGDYDGSTADARVDDWVKQTMAYDAAQSAVLDEYYA